MAVLFQFFQKSSYLSQSLDILLHDQNICSIVSTSSKQKLHLSFGLKFQDTYNIQTFLLMVLLQQ
jgi:hypothetical protein